MKLKNKGGGNSYNTKYSIIIQSNLSFIDHNSGSAKISKTINNLDQTILTFDNGTSINEGELNAVLIYLRYSKYIDSFDLLTTEQLNNFQLN